ncbi:chemotaxis protein CheR [Alteromonas sp. D210916BOD_24]|uniref:CheR family methyltransferase n=1 Tax=Alteromonas sp. D210916BOD_24 TaxID=3157618 RepID=UPI00399CAE3D
MPAPLNAAAQREFTYRRDDFVRVKEMLFSKAGISLSDSKDALVYSRLSRRLRTLKMDSFTQYLDYVVKSDNELEHFINALTTNLTAFLRESHHFDALSQYLKNNPNCKRIWCAASSTGEEPYSIAMTVAATLGTFNTDISIIATDIDSNVLQTAQNGIYPIELTKQLPHSYKTQFLYRGKGSHKGKVKVVDELKKMVRFEPLNLTSDHWGVSGPLDVIFCRNVMIYFDKNTQKNILQRMVKMLKPNGMYVAGHSENFSMYPELVTPMGKTIYRPAK